MVSAPTGLLVTITYGFIRRRRLASAARKWNSSPAALEAPRVFLPHYTFEGLSIRHGLLR